MSHNAGHRGSIPESSASRNTSHAEAPDPNLKPFFGSGYGHGIKTDGPTAEVASINKADYPLLRVEADDADQQQGQVQSEDADDEDNGTHPPSDGKSDRKGKGKDL